MAGAWLALGASGCAPEVEGEPAPDRTGPQVYACDDGSEVQVNFVAGGLSLELASAGERQTQRLDSPRLGLPFVGDGVTAYNSNGGLLIIGSEGPSRRCRPAPPRPP